MPLPISVVHADPDLLAVDKPYGVLSMPDRYDPDAPVASAILRTEYGRLMVVHRIDKDTSGLLLYARNPEAHRSLSEAFATGAVAKTYHALVRGMPDREENACDLPLRVDGDRDHRTLIDAHRGKDSRTVFRVLERYESRGTFPGAALVEASPETGRTHQIRVHLAALGFPCLCDPLYGDGKEVLLSKMKKRWKGDALDERPLLSRTALHALAAAFTHPATGEAMRLEVQPPKDMRAAMAQMRKL